MLEAQILSLLMEVSSSKTRALSLAMLNEQEHDDGEDEESGG